MTILMNSVTQLKRSLRKEIGARLKEVPLATVAKESEQVTKQLLSLDIYKQSRNVSVFISLPHSEIDTRAIIHAILHASDGKSLYVPRWTKDSMDMVKLTSWEAYQALPVNKWNIPEPPHDQPMETALETEGLDLILVPAMAFDTERNRIGHGKGYYDRYLEKCRNWAIQHHTNSPVTIGLALEAQLLDSEVIPIETTDKKLDWVLTSNKIIH
ncbi:hypothetical protein EC973_008451 [Apophysomyces ossiformis]|uniref:5-formyltetrahydrofolate cyclo-ligase n=1 Tax=Apophysomyces ossiformis TaxID=679940 RepID=A0A8H7BNK9_9FUNG|nr:hypothetical protein EC973_008451 [Apophysomyces ossiformis]